MIITAGLFSILPKIIFFRNKLISTAIAFTCPILLVTTIVCLFYWYPHDFASDITIYQYLITLLCSLFIVISLFSQLPFAVEIGTLIAAIFAVIIGNFTIDFFPEIPSWINQILSIFALWSFALGWKAICGLNPLPQLESITISGGIFLLYLFGVAPFILGVTSSIILSASVIAYIYSSRSPLGINSSPLIGFIFGWMGLICYQEYLFPCFITFSLFYLLELFIALIRKLTFLPQYQELAYNTISVKSFTSGFPSSDIIHSLWNTNILLLIFGLLQIHGKSTYSLPIFAAIITSWQLYRMSNWQQASKTLKETNQELISGLKASLHNIFSSDNSDKEDKK